MTASHIVVCPSCAGMNRVPDAKMADAPKCGKCGNPLFKGYAPDVDQVAFDRHVGRGQLPVVVDFWASWCGPCRAMAPAFAAAAAELEPQVRLIKLNTETQQAVAARYGIRSIPTLILFKGGKEIARHSGAIDTAQLVNWVRRAGA